MAGWNSTTKSGNEYVYDPEPDSSDEIEFKPSVEIIDIAPLVASTNNTETCDKSEPQCAPRKKRSLYKILKY